MLPNQNADDGTKVALQGVDSSCTSWAYEDIKLYLKPGLTWGYWREAHNGIGCCWSYPGKIHDKLNILRDHCDNKGLCIDSKILAQMAKYIAEADASSYLAEYKE